MRNILEQKEIEAYTNLLELWQKEAFKAFSYRMTDIDHPFPCIPATIGYQLNHLRYSFINDINQEQSIYELADVLKTYGTYSKETGTYASLIVFINSTTSLSVEEYEQLFWKLLMKLNDLDEKKWPDHIPQNPHNPAWEFCFNGEPYFVYCATPEHKKRESRSFPFMMLAITPRWVLQDFHNTHPNIEKMKTKIRERLASYDKVPAHPDLKSYGQEDNYEWKQYYLRDDETSLPSCPFSKVYKK